MRTLALSMLLLGGTLAIADPPGKIIIRPNGAPSFVPADPAPPPLPDQPGKIIIRPHAPGSRVLETGTIPPTAPTAPPTNPLPVPTPKPVADPTPATPPKTDADPDKGKILNEAWEIAYIKGLKVGHSHVVVREYQRDGKTYHHATKAMEITIARFKQRVTTTAEDSTLETPEGAVVAVRMSQEISSGQKLTVVGQVEGSVLRTKVEGMGINATNTLPWPEGVIGISKELSIYKDKKPKPGDTFDYNFYEGRTNRAVKITVTCKALETVALVEGQKPKPFLRLEVQSEPLGNFRFPPAKVWVDAATFELVRTDYEMPSLGGRVTMLRTTKEVALRPVGDVPDLFDVQSIHLDKSIPNVHDQSSVTYRIDLHNDFEPLSCFAKDDRQTPKLLDPEKKIIELKVLSNRSVDTAVPAVLPKPPDAKIYLGKSYFIDWDNAITKKQADTIAATLPLNASVADKAKAVESWVYRNMKSVEFSQAMATTSEVSKTLSGDCSEFSMLAVGLCRALGVPARTTLGVVYANGPGGKPVLAYHMWFEVWQDYRWVAYDGTLGRGGIGPGHIKITDAHWHDEHSFAPLLPVLRVLNAEPKVTISAVEAMK